MITTDRTIIDVLRCRADSQPDRLAYCFLSDDGVTPEAQLTYAALEGRVRKIAAGLLRRYRPGDRAILLFPPGLAFVEAFYGCLYAGLVPVPLYPPSRNANLERLLAVVPDVEAVAALSTQRLEARLRSQLHEAFEHLPFDIVATDGLTSDPDDAMHLEPRRASPDDVVFLQYSSGSTGQPRGVQVTQGSLLHNVQVVTDAFGLSEESVVVGWLPVYHDMGLIGKVLTPLYGGFPVYLMAPTTFLRRPLRWLEAITRYGVTESGAPNFAYELCVRRTTPEQRAGLDLSTWRLAFCGAEPVRAETLARFTEAFAPHGFRAEAFYPCYGLAESTLIATGGDHRALPVVRTLDRQRLREGHAETAPAEAPAADRVACVGCGHPRLGMEVRVVDPETRTPVADGTIGEIWIAGPSVAGGYRNDDVATRETFDAHTADGDGPFLRTGDLGFHDAGELFVTGRRKDLIILHGSNYYPHDIEAAVEAAHPDLHPAQTIAFSVDTDGVERLVIAAELDRHGARRVDLDALAAAVGGAVANAQGLTVSALVVLGPGQLPRTSSGKVRRGTCRDRYLDRTLEPLAVWKAPVLRPAMKPSEPTARVSTSRLPHVSPGANGSAPADANSAAKADALIDWLRDYAGRRLNSRLMDERRTITPHVVLDFGNQGVLGMSVPAEFGGLGLKDVDTMRVVQQLGAIDLNLASFVGVHLALGAHPIQHHASAALRERLLPDIAAGRSLAAFALTEPGAGSNPRALAATAVADGHGGWHLHGDKSWIGSGSWAGVVNTFVRLRGSDGDPQGITGFVVEADNPGLHAGHEALTMGMRGMVQNDLHLRDAPVTEAALLGAPGAGMAVAQDAMTTGRLGIAAMSVGVIRRAAQQFYRYSAGRTVGAGRLLELPLTKERLAAMGHAATAVEALVERLAALRDLGIAVPDAAYAAAKIAGPELAWRAVDALVQGLGGRGYMENNGAPQMLRDVRLLRIFEGPTEALQYYLGALTLRDGRELRHLVGTLLDASHMAGELEAVLQPVRESLASGVHTGPGGVRHGLADRCGALLPWAVLAGALEGRPPTQRTEDHEEALAWVRRRFFEQRDRVVAPASSAWTLDTATLARRVEAVAHHIGDVEQRLPGTDTTLDPRLRRAPAGGARAPVPIAPQREGPAPQREELAPQREERAPQPEGRVPHTSRIGAAATRDAREMETWIVDWLARETDLEAADMDPARPFAYHGVDSIVAAEFVVALEEKLERPVSLDLLWELPSIRALAEHLSTHHPSPASPPVASDEPASPTALSAPAPAPATHPPVVPAPETTSSPAPTNGRLPRVLPTRPSGRPATPYISLFFFGEGGEAGGKTFPLLLQCARFADAHGFHAVWTPERHFHPFGGAFPAPAVLGAALARETKHLQIRAGSVVLPLHHPIRVAEEWAVVDRLSDGRVGVSVTPGWNPNDFALAPEAYDDRTAGLADRLDAVRRLWRGDAVAFTNGKGEEADLKLYPRPVQPELPVWLTCNRRPEGFVQAGTLGTHVLTALLAQTPASLAERIADYRAARAAHGHDPATGRVTLMLHTFIGTDEDTARDRVRTPLKNYLRSAANLWQQGSERLSEMTPEAQERVLKIALERYIRTSTLIGTVETCREAVRQFHEMGVDEIACLVDFGLSPDVVAGGLPGIAALATKKQTEDAEQDRDAVQERDAVEERDTIQKRDAEPSPRPPRRHAAKGRPKEASSVQSGPWLYTDVPRPDAGLRLLCLPFAGGDHSAFRGWEALLPSVEVTALNVPQHTMHLADLLDAVLPDLLPLLDRPYAFYGHSVGALIAFELARRLRREGVPLPEHLIVGAQHAPHVPYPHASVDALLGPEADRFWREQAPEVLARPEAARTALLERFIRRLEPAIRIQSENYDYAADDPLSCAITALHGRDDGLLSPQQLQAWADHTDGAFRFLDVPGGHLFLDRHRAATVSAVAEVLGTRFVETAPAR